mmetsp:Transcript_61629/g.191465  ORF Transcript_61629/g.191465 Transcript_61629/m.191465 type:complete len:236 (+) Transcript_61629:82-789(+)
MLRQTRHGCLGFAVVASWLAMVCGVVGADKVQVVNGVMKLEVSNFDRALERFPVLMVNFYAPWCGGCNGFAPTYEKAARRLRKRDMPAPRLAKVDITVEPKLEKKYDSQVSVEPVLLVFKDGRLFGRYAGARDKEDIIDYLDTVRSPPVLGDAQRAYLRLRGAYKELLRAFAPGKEQQRAGLAAFPAVLLGLPSLAALFLAGCLRCCCGCCGRGSGAAGPAAEAAGPGPAAKKED